MSLLDQNPNAGREELFSQFQTALKLRPSLQRPVDWYFFAGMLGDLKNSPKRRPDPLDVEKEKSELSRRLHNRVLMDVLLPNGKKLRDSTFRACAEAGGWFGKIAAMGKPDQIVGAILTEQELPDLDFN